MTAMQALKIAKPHEAALITLERPLPGPGQVLIKVMASSGVCGTDVHILEGEYLGAYSVIPGHEFAGLVEQVGIGVSRIQVGDRVAVEPNIACDNWNYCLNNQQNFCENWQAVGVTLPGNGGIRRRAREGGLRHRRPRLRARHLCRAVSCVLHGIQKTGIRLADRVALLGAGLIGILLLHAVIAQGAQSVSVVELDPAHAETTQAFGADRVVRSLDELPKGAFEVVIDTTGVIPAMQRAPEFSRKGGKVLLFGVPPKTTVAFDAFSLFVNG